MCTQKNPLTSDSVNVPILHPESLDEHIAWWVSNLFSPPVLGLVLLVIASIDQPTPHVWRWIGVYLALALLFPFGFLLWQLKKGEISDIEVYHREQRSSGLLATAGGFAIAGIVLVLMRAPVIFLMMAIAGLLMWLAIYGITLRWKISIHSASATASTLMIVYILGHAFFWLLAIIPIVAWSRVRLRKHSLLQTLAGTGLATGLFIILLSVIRLV